MYCIWCNKDCSKEDKCCLACGHKLISSQNEWKRWRSIFSEYSKEKLQEMVANSSEYQEDAVIAAEYLLDNFPDEITKDTINDSYENNHRIIEWYYVMDGERKGPVSEKDLIQLYSNEVIDDRTPVWKQGFTNWISISQVGIMLPTRKGIVMPPVNANQMNNKSIIILLFVPILSTLIQYFIAGWFQVDAAKLWWVAVGLNYICCSIDCIMVKKAGYKADKLMGAVVFLIPLYIYKRMALVHGKKWLCTIIWTAVFVADLFIPSVFWVKAVDMSNPEMINGVKDSRPYNYEDMTIGEIFDGALDECTWCTYMGADRRILIQVNGKIDTYTKLDTVFVVNLDNSIDISSMSINGKSCDNSIRNAVMDLLYENASMLVGNKDATADSGKYLLNSQMLIDNDGFQRYLDEELDRIDSDFQKSECCKMNPGYNLRYENVTSADLISDRRNFDVYISNRANENINASDSPQFSYFLFDADGDSLIDTIMIAFYSYGTMGNGWSDFLWDEITETVKRNLTVLTDLSTEKRNQVYATLWGDQEQDGDPQWARTKVPTVCKVGNFHIRAAFVSSAESNFIFTSIQDEDWLNNLFSDCNIIDLSSNDTL